MELKREEVREICRVTVGYLRVTVGHINSLLPVGRYINITWTPTPQGCLYLGPSPFDLDNTFFAESVLTSYNFLASLQIIFNL